MSSPPDPAPPASSSALPAFLTGFRATWTSVFSYVLFGTYTGIGAIAHDFGFSLFWAMLATILVWAGPAQVILISALGAGGSLIEVAVAVCLSGVRLLPMVVSLLPIIRGPDTRPWQLLMPAHFTAVSMWVEALRLLPGQPRENRIAFCNGLGTGYGFSALVATVFGFYLAASLPPLMSAALLFLTPLAFFMSAMRNSRMLIDRLAFVLGFVIGPLLAYYQVGLDLVWSGMVGGTTAYAVHRLREATR